MSYEKNSYSFIISDQVVKDLRFYMSTNGVSQVALASKLKTTQSAVQRWLSSPGVVAKGEPAQRLEKLMSEIGTGDLISVDLRVYERVKRYKEENELSWEKLSELMDMSLVDCVTLIEKQDKEVDLNLYMQLMKGYINVVEGRS